MTQQFFSAPNPSPEMTSALMAASGRSRADRYYFAPKREYLDGTGPDDKFYSYKDSAWVPRSALPEDAQIILVTHCHDMSGGPCMTLEEACEKNAAYLRAQIEAEQDASTGGGGLSLDEVKALIAEAVRAHGTDTTAHAATIAAAVSAAVSAHSADTSAHVEAIKPLIATAVSEHGADPTAHASAISTAIGTHNTDPTAHPDIREAITSGGGGGGETPIDPPVDPVDPPSAPVITMADRLPIGRTASIGLSATPAATATIAKFSVTVGDAAAVDVTATDNAGTHTITPSGTAGDTLTVKATATDSFDSVSTEATATAELIEYTYPIYSIMGNNTANVLKRSDDKGKTFSEVSGLPITGAIWSKCVISKDRDKVYLCHISEGKTLTIYRSIDNGASWQTCYTREQASSIYSIQCLPSALVMCYYNSSALTRNIACSTDYGDTWIESVPNFAFNAITEGYNGRFFTFVSEGSYFYSDDLGKSWKLNNFAAGSPTPSHILPIPGTSGTVCMLMSNGATNISQDNGITWTSYTSGQSSASAVIYLPGDKLIKAARPNTSTYNYTSIYKSENFGQTWTLIKALPITSIIGLYTYPDGLILASGTKGNISRSVDNGVTWSAAQASGYTGYLYLT